MVQYWLGKVVVRCLFVWHLHAMLRETWATASWIEREGIEERYRLAVLPRHHLATQSRRYGLRCEQVPDVYLVFSKGIHISCVMTHRCRSSKAASSHVRRRSSSSRTRVWSSSMESFTPERCFDWLRDERHVSLMMSAAATLNKKPSARKFAPFSMALRVG